MKQAFGRLRWRHVPNVLLAKSQRVECVKVWALKKNKEHEICVCYESLEYWSQINGDTHATKKMSKRQGQIYMLFQESWLKGLVDSLSHGAVGRLLGQCSKERLIPKHCCRPVCSEAPGLGHPAQRPFAKLQTVALGSPDALESCTEKWRYAPSSGHLCSQAPGTFKNNELFLFVIRQPTLESYQTHVLKVCVRLQLAECP